MASPSNDYFYKMILHLRSKEEVVLYDNIVESTLAEDESVTAFLETEYARETLNYPHRAPAYNPEAALWGAKIVYVAAQLILYRENKEKDLALLLPDFAFDKDASSMLSADLCLRFLPDMITRLKLIDSEDALIHLLEIKLQQWHYSGVNYPLNIALLDFKAIVTNASLLDQYCNRIIEHKRLDLAQQIVFSDTIKAHLGIHAAALWNDFNFETSSTIHE